MSFHQVEARKSYVCRNCNKPIFKGTLYQIEKTKINDQFITVREHINCQGYARQYEVMGAL